MRVGERDAAMMRAVYVSRAGANGGGGGQAGTVTQTDRQTNANGGEQAKNHEVPGRGEIWGRACAVQSVVCRLQSAAEPELHTYIHTYLLTTVQTW